MAGFGISGAEPSGFLIRETSLSVSQSVNHSVSESAS